MSTAVAWLEARCADVPAGLADRVREALSEATRDRRSADGTALSQVLLDAAVTCMKAALDQGPRREAAAHLLAADALLTWASEAAAEEGGGSLDALAGEASRRLAAQSSDAQR